MDKVYIIYSQANPVKQDCVCCSFMCVCICLPMVSTNIYTGSCACFVCACKSQRLMLGVFLYCCSPSVLRQDLTWTKSLPIWLMYLLGSLLQGTLFSLTLGLQVGCHTDSALKWMLGIWSLWSSHQPKTGILHHFIVDEGSRTQWC